MYMWSQKVFLKSVAGRFLKNIFYTKILKKKNCFDIFFHEWNNIFLVTNSIQNIFVFHEQLRKNENRIIAIFPTPCRKKLYIYLDIFLVKLKRWSFSPCIRFLCSARRAVIKNWKNSAVSLLLQKLSIRWERL